MDVTFNSVFLCTECNLELLYNLLWLIHLFSNNYSVSVVLKLDRLIMDEGCLLHSFPARFSSHLIIVIEAFELFLLHTYLYRIILLLLTFLVSPFCRIRVSRLLTLEERILTRIHTRFLVLHLEALALFCLA